MTARPCAPVSDASWQMGTDSIAGTPAQHAATGGATGLTVRAVGSQAFERQSVAFPFARLAALHAEVAQIYGQMAEIELDARCGSALMGAHPNGGNDMGNKIVPGHAEALLTVRDVANRLQVNERTVRRWREERRLPPALVIAGIVRWRAADVDEWIARTVETAS